LCGGCTEVVFTFARRGTYIALSMGEKYRHHEIIIVIDKKKRDNNYHQEDEDAPADLR